MKNNESFSFVKRIKSFGFALSGIKTFFTLEHNAWLQAISAITAIALGCWFQLSTMEWVAITIAIGMVVVTEMLNTAIEQLTDIVSPQYSEKAKKVKDLSAGAVLLAAIAAAVIGVIVFSKYFIVF